jgi:hypothetical protein
MLAEAGIGDPDQVFIELCLAFTFLVLANQHDRLLQWVKRKSKAP